VIVDDYHALAAVLSVEVARAAGRETVQRAPVYLDARVPATMHLRLVSALHKPTGGRLTRLVQTAAPDSTYRAALIDAIATPRADAVVVLDDRPVAAVIGALTAEPGVSVAFGALMAHAQATGHPILIDPANSGRWLAAAAGRRIEVVTRPGDGQLMPTRTARFEAAELTQIWRLMPGRAGKCGHVRVT